MKKSVIKSNSGFTLVELMVVVAIIGILSAVAIPNFKKYQAKSKTSEAKMALAAIYMSETSFFSDADTYATCLGDMGYAPSGAASERYYNVGFAAGVAVSGNSVNGVVCNGTTNFQYLGTKGGTSTTHKIVSTAPTTTTFRAGAAGVVSRNFNKDNNCSKFTINETKTLLQTQVGY